MLNFHGHSQCPCIMLPDSAKCVELEFIMLHAKVHDHRAISSVGKDFEGFYNIWVWWKSWSCDLNHLYVLCLAFQRRLHIRFGFDWPISFREKDPRKWWSYTSI